jgi:hypothetical protein
MWCTVWLKIAECEAMNLSCLTHLQGPCTLLCPQIICTVTVAHARLCFLKWPKQLEDSGENNHGFWPVQHLVCALKTRCSVLCCSVLCAVLCLQWLSMRLELTGAVVVSAAAVAVGVVAPRNAGLAGLALTSALNLTGTSYQITKNNS